jgi:hypothetical protein
MYGLLQEGRALEVAARRYTLVPLQLAQERDETPT